MKSIESYVSDLTEAELAAAAGEIIEWERSCVLPEGVVTRVSQEIVRNFLGMDTAKARKAVWDCVLFRCTREYAKLKGKK